MGLIRRWSANLGLALLTIFLIAVLTETVLRFTPNKNLLSFSRSHVPPHYYRTDPVMGYDIQENFPKTDVFLDDGVKYAIWSNELGCFDEPLNSEKDSILLVGDSFTHAFAPFEDKWGTQIEALTGTRVLKCGVSGFGTKQAALKADSVCAKIKDPPRLIVVGYTMNDFMDDYLFPHYSATGGYHYISKRLKDEKTGEISTKVRVRPPMSMRIWLKQHSILFNMSEQAIKRFSPAKEEVMVKTDAIDGECSAALECKYPWLKGAWEAHLNNMRSFSALPRMGNGKVLFVIIPVKEQVYSFLAGEKDPALDKKYAILLEHMKKEGIPYLDLLPLFRQYADQTARRRLDSKKDYYWAVDGHWNVKGNHLAGLLVSEYILEKRIIDIPEREAKLALIRDKLTTFK